MKKIIIFLNISLVLCACSNDEYVGMSNSIKESKDKKVFVCKYSSELQIPDSLKFETTEIWLEKCWKSKPYDNNIRIRDDYQLIILTKDDICNKTNYSISWHIGTEFKDLFRSCGRSCFMLDLDSVPPNTKNWKIHLGSDKYDKRAINIIGNLKLTRKD
jgi:hypothetical protein